VSMAETGPADEVRRQEPRPFGCDPGSRHCAVGVRRRPHTTPGPSGSRDAHHSPTSVTFTAIGDSQQFTAQVRDQYGNVMTSVSVNWVSLRPTVATVDLSTGLVTAAGSGVATITARASSASGEATVTVAQEIEAMEKTAGDEEEGYFGEPLPVAPAVRLLDANGHPAADIAVTFEVTSGGGTVSPDTVVTRADGLAETTWTLGREAVQTLTAAAAGLTADFRVTASRLPLAIDTDSLRQGRVTVSYNEGLKARGGSTEGYVWSLPEDSRLPAGLELSPDGMIQGTPLEADSAEFRGRVADSEGGEATATLGMRVCDGPLGLELGDVHATTWTDTRTCGLFVRAPDASAYYRVTLAGSDPSEGRLINALLRVEAVAPEETPLQRPVVAARRETREPALRPGAEEDWARLLEIEAANAALHRQIRRQEADLMEQLAAEGRLTGMIQRGIEAQAARRGTAADSPMQRTFRLYSREDGASRCVVDRTVVADIIAENEHMVVYEEETAQSRVPVANANRIIDFYSAHGAEIIERYFGGVSDVNGDGKIVVLVDPALTGVRGYAWSGDMTFTALDCPASNEMELVHMSAGAFTQLDDDRYWAMSGLVHEVKHVSSLYKRVRSDVLRGRPDGVRTFHPTWIEEGTADIAKEMSSRLGWEREGGPTVGERVNREMIRDGLSNMRPEAYGTFGVMARVVRAFSVDPNAVTFEPLGEGTVYGSGWHFHRFLRDRLAFEEDSTTDDEALVTALNDSLALPGIDGLVAVTGMNIGDLLIEHATALTVAGAEAWLGDETTPHFRSYDFPTATEVFSNPDPPGRYPWPVTLTGEDDDTSVPAVQLARRHDFSGLIGGSGVRVHDFEAMAEGAGAVFRPTSSGTMWVIVARIPKPAGFQR